jgi:HEAT repeat protein
LHLIQEIRIMARSPRRRSLFLLQMALLCGFAPLPIVRAQQMLQENQARQNPKLSTQIQTLENPNDKAGATTFLGIIDQAIEGLLPVISNSQAPVAKRLAAIEGLQAMGPNAEMAIPHLSKALADKNPAIRLATVRALTQIGGRAKLTLGQLIPRLKDEHEEVQIATAQLIEQLGWDARKAIPVLVEIVEYGRPNVQLAAIKALTPMGGAAREAIEPLIRRLDHDNRDIQKAAIMALGSMGKEAKPAVRPLAELLDKGDRQLKSTVALALCNIGAEAAESVGELERLLAQSGEAELRSLAARALAAIGEPAARSVPLLTQALGDANKDVRSRSAMALGRIGIASRSALPELVKSLHDGNPDVRLSSSLAISQIAGKLQDQRSQLRRQQLMKSIGHLETAIAILEDPNQGFSEEITVQVRRSLTELKEEQNSRPLDLLTDWAQANPIFAAILLYGTIAPGFWLLVLWFRPLWILKINNTLQPYTDFELPMPMGNSIKIPLRFVLFVGWFHYHPRVLDAWVEEHVEVARYAFAQKSTAQEREVHIPIPVILQGKTVAELASSNLHHTFGDGRQCLLIWGEGGSGKTSLASGV